MAICDCESVRTFADYLKTQQKMNEDKSDKISRPDELVPADYVADALETARVRLIELMPQCFSKQEYDSAVAYERLIEGLTDIAMNKIPERTIDDIL